MRFSVDTHGRSVVCLGMKHEKSEISEHEVRFLVAVKSGAGWKTANQLAVEAKISERTSRAYALKFVRLGLCDLAEVFPRHRYRFSDKAKRRNTAYLLRLEEAQEVFGIQC